MQIDKVFLEKIVSIIFVSATALTSGGGLITLKQFLDNIPSASTDIYYVFCSVKSMSDEYSRKNIKFIFPKYTKRMARIYWDHIGLKKWAETNKIKPQLIISLQNTTISYDRSIPQITYVMQAIPFVDIKWNIFKKNERVLWFYKNIYPFFMRIGLGANNFVVTQSEWIKYEFAKKFNFPLEKIFAIRPIINIMSTPDEKQFNQNEYNIFCPSSPFVYKNNVEISNALSFLKSKNVDISKLRVYVTFEDKDDIILHKSIQKNHLENNFCFIGRMPYNEMLEYYKGCDLVVFPSYLETFGLPLLEAASFGKPILCANEAYSREVIESYEGAKLLNKNSPQLWGESLLEEIHNKRTYQNYKADFQESWEEFFKIVEKIIHQKDKDITD